MKSTLATIRTFLLYIVLTIPITFILTISYNWTFRIFLGLPEELLFSKWFLCLYSIFSGYVLTGSSILLSIYLNKIKSYNTIMAVFIVSLAFSFICIASCVFFIALNFNAAQWTYVLYASIGMLVCSVMLIALTKKGLIFKDSKDPKLKLNKYGKLFYDANNGEAEAQYELANLYYDGVGVKQNFVEAENWYLKAAKQDHIFAQWGLGLLYGINDLSVRDFTKSAIWLENAALQGLTEAQFLLGSLYSVGEGVEQDFNKAFYWLNIASINNHPTAQCNLALLYEKGDGIEQNYYTAVNWYKQAALYGNNDAQYNLARLFMIDNGKYVCLIDAYKMVLLSYKECPSRHLRNTLLLKNKLETLLSEDMVHIAIKEVNELRKTIKANKKKILDIRTSIHPLGIYNLS